MDGVCQDERLLRGLPQRAVGVPAILTDAVLVGPVGTPGLNGPHDLMTALRPLGDNVSVQLGAGKGFAANRTRAFEIEFHIILSSKPQTMPANLMVRMVKILTP